MAEGVAKKISIYSILLQIASTVGLMMGAKILVEFLMLNCFAEKIHFRRLKYLKTKDMND